jgi:hypothetical protein
MRLSELAPMTSRKTTLTVVGGALLVTYFAAANMPSQDAESPRDRARPAATAGTESLAEEVRSQASRLQARMAQAPAPEDHPRNPFAFGMAPRPLQADPPVRAATVVDDAPAPMAPPPPPLTLMGVAEEAVIGGFRRTAVIGGEGDAIYIVTEGQPVADRYKVTKIGADAIELEDLVTKGYRRLALR